MSGAPKFCDHDEYHTDEPGGSHRTLPEPMTRRQTYRHCMVNGWSRRDSILAALLSDAQRPEHYDHRPMFTVERSGA